MLTSSLKVRVETVLRTRNTRESAPAQANDAEAEYPTGITKTKPEP